MYFYLPVTSLIPLSTSNVSELAIAVYGNVSSALATVPKWRGAQLLQTEDGAPFGKP